MAQARTTNTGHPLEGFRAWQRAHIRLTTLYGSAVLFTLVMMGVAFYKLGVDFAIASLQQRLLATTTSLASAIDGDAVAAIPVESSTVTPLSRSLRHRGVHCPPATTATSSNETPSGRSGDSRQ